MSKLPNAPLVEVVFELRWNVDTKAELARCQYLHGDLFAQVKDEFPFRESLVAPEVPIEVYINHPSHRFRFRENDYPLIQIGPGVLTLNTIDSKYIWNDFESKISDSISKFLNVYQFESNKNISLSLQYFDLFDFDFEKENVLDFITKNLNLTVNQDFLDNSSFPQNINLNFTYTIDLGNLSISLARGKSNTNKDGIIMQTNLFVENFNTAVDDIKNWLTESHDFCSDLFKKMTKGKLYESFNVK